MRCMRRFRPMVRTFSTHEKQIRVLEHGNSSKLPVTYPDSDVINPRHFYQSAVQQVTKSAPRPVSLRQLAFFGRKLNTEKLIMSANYVREELTLRVGHRVLEMQKLPYKIVSNPHLTKVYERYYQGFEKLRKIRKIETLQDNEAFCKVISTLLQDNGQAVPDLLLGVLELVQRGEAEKPEFMDSFVSSMLMSRISRRVIAEQHVSLSEAFAKGITNEDKDQDYIGEVFLQCNTTDVIQKASHRLRKVLGAAYPDVPVPEVVLEGTEATFPYIESHVDYIIGEVLRNSIVATMLSAASSDGSPPNELPPVVVSVSGTKENVFIRVSDQGGGIPPTVMSSIWSFAKPHSGGITRQNLNIAWPNETASDTHKSDPLHSTLQQFSDRDPSLKLGIGLALSRVYTEYWGGALDIHSLEGYGCDALLRISRLGTKLENLHLNRV